MMNDIAQQIDWIERLIGHDTTSFRSNFNLIEDVEEYLRKHGVETQRVPNDDGDKTNLFAIIGPNEPGGVILSGHTDVVPVEGQAWDSDPFALTTREGKLYGRGTCDMKSFLAIALSLVPEMIEKHMKRPIILAMSYDEEIGCVGAPRMIERIRQDIPAPMAAIIGEPSNMRVIDGHKGIASFKTTVHGFTTHSSQTDRGVSAVENAARLITFLSDMRRTYEAKADPENPFHPPHTTMTVNLVNGGTQLNIMAAEASFEWDLRLIPDDQFETIRDEFDAYCREIETEMQKISPTCSIETEQMTYAPALAPRNDNSAADLAKSLTGHNATDVVAYAAEAGQFQEAGFPTVICGPGSIDQAHQANEFITLDQVHLGTKFQRALIEKLAS